MQQVHVVQKEEHHYLPTCPCTECRRERRQQRRQGRMSSIKSFPPEDAFALGYIPTRQPAGSLARQLQGDD